MSDPVEYTIVRNLQAAIGAATVAGGYHYAIAATAVKLDPNHESEGMVAPDGPRPFALIEVLADTWAYNPANEAILTTKLQVHWTHDTDPTDDRSLLLTYFSGCADVERAITQDITRGGLAVDTRITGRTHVPTDAAGKTWATLDVEIRHYRDYGAPDGA